MGGPGSATVVTDLKSRVRPPAEFYQDAWSHAVDYRLAAARRVSGRLLLSDNELANLWRAAQECYRHQDWPRLMAARDILEPALDLRGD